MSSYPNCTNCIIEFINESSFPTDITLTEKEGKISVNNKQLDLSQAPKDPNGNIGRFLITSDGNVWIDEVKFYDVQQDIYFPEATRSEMENIYRRKPLHIYETIIGNNSIISMKANASITIS